MVSCALRSCNSRSGVDRKGTTGITFHRFPTEIERREKWLQFVDRLGWKPTKHSVLCSKHFDEQYVDRTSLGSVRLRSNAIPTSLMIMKTKKHKMDITSNFVCLPNYIPMEASTIQQSYQPTTASSFLNKEDDESKTEKIFYLERELSNEEQRLILDEELLNNPYIKEERIDDSEIKVDEVFHKEMEQSSKQQESAPFETFLENAHTEVVHLNIEGLENIQETIPNDVLLDSFNIKEEHIDVRRVNEFNLVIEQSDKSTELIRNSELLDNFNIKEKNIDEDDTKVYEESSAYYKASISMDLEKNTIKHLQPKVELIEQNLKRCVPCGTNFLVENLLIDHGRECPHQKEEPAKLTMFICNVCKMGTLDKGYYDKYEKRCKMEYLCMNNQYNTTNVNSKNLKCDKCNFSTNFNLQLEKHILVHNDKKQFACLTCNKSFNTKFHFTIHMKNHNAEREKRFMCLHCNNGYHNKVSLIFHMNEKHLQNREYKCHKCTYVTARKDSLKRHTLWQHSSKVKNYKCDYCEYSTHVEKYLARHISVHINEKLFKCSYQNCDYKSIESHHLKLHIKHRHTFEKCFKCDQCDYKCVRKNALQHHVYRKHNYDRQVTNFTIIHNHISV